MTAHAEARKHAALILVHDIMACAYEGDSAEVARLIKTADIGICRLAFYFLAFESAHARTLPYLARGGEDAERAAGWKFAADERRMRQATADMANASDPLQRSEIALRSLAEALGVKP